MKTYKNLYRKLCSYENLFLAYKKARKGKTKKDYVIRFEKNLYENLKMLQRELMDKSYSPRTLKKFIIRDPKTRKICRAIFRDRIVHHAVVNILNPIYEKIFIYDSYASRKNKGHHKALERFDYLKRKVSRNGKKLKGIKDNNYVCGYCLKIDIKHYFDTVDHNILINIIKKKIKDESIIWLIRQILGNHLGEIEDKGMPLGNYTSQFFANVYLSPLDYFIKHKLKAKYYIRYVDDFIILHNSKSQLENWKENTDYFLRDKLRLELHPEKSRIISLSRGIDFVGFRNFYYYKLLRKRNIRNMENKIKLFADGILNYEKLLESFQGWQTYAKWADTYKLRKKLSRKLRYAIS